MTSYLRRPQILRDEGWLPETPAPCSIDKLACLVARRRAELVKMEQRKGALAIEIQNAQSVGLVNVVGDGCEMSTITLLCQLDRNFVGNKLSQFLF